MSNRSPVWINLLSLIVLGAVIWIGIGQIVYFINLYYYNSETLIKSANVDLPPGVAVISSSLEFSRWAPGVTALRLILLLIFTLLWLRLKFYLGLFLNPCPAEEISLAELNSTETAETLIRRLLDQSGFGKCFYRRNRGRIIEFAANRGVWGMYGRFLLVLGTITLISGILADHYFGYRLLSYSELTLVPTISAINYSPASGGEPAEVDLRIPSAGIAVLTEKITVGDHIVRLISILPGTAARRSGIVFIIIGLLLILKYPFAKLTARLIVDNSEQRLPQQLAAEIIELKPRCWGFQLTRRIFPAQFP